MSLGKKIDTNVLNSGLVYRAQFGNINYRTRNSKDVRPRYLRAKVHVHGVL